MNKGYRLLQMWSIIGFVFAMLILCTIAYLIGFITTTEEEVTIKSNEDCCEITIKRIDNQHLFVHYRDHVGNISYKEIITEDTTLIKQDRILYLKQELEETINQYQEYCYYNHFK